MKFIVNGPRENEMFSPIYYDEEYSLDVFPKQESGVFSIMVNNLYFEINENNEVLYIWGLCPLFNYEETLAHPKKIQACKLNVLLDEPIIPGISYRLNKSVEWPVYINKAEKLICIGDPDLSGKTLVEFAPNTIACLEKTSLNAIWVKLSEFPIIN